MKKKEIMRNVVQKQHLAARPFLRREEWATSVYLTPHSSYQEAQTDVWHGFSPGLKKHMATPRKLLSSLHSAFPELTTSLALDPRKVPDSRA